MHGRILSSVRGPAPVEYTDQCAARRRQRQQSTEGTCMGPYVDAIMSDEAMPAATTVAVIGGGIIGTYAALWLASRGIPVVLCEKGYIACEQSQPQLGLVPAGGARRARKCR